jgi:hypothetical protein
MSAGFVQWNTRSEEAEFYAGISDYWVPMVRIFHILDGGSRYGEIRGIAGSSLQ